MKTLSPSIFVAISSPASPPPFPSKPRSNRAPRPLALTPPSRHYRRQEARSAVNSSDTPLPLHAHPSSFFVAHRTDLFRGVFAQLIDRSAIQRSLPPQHGFRRRILEHLQHERRQQPHPQLPHLLRSSQVPTPPPETLEHEFRQTPVMAPP